MSPLIVQATKSIRPSTRPIALKRSSPDAEIVELDHIRVEEDLRRRSEVDAVLLSIGFLLGAVPLEVHPRASNRSY